MFNSQIGPGCWINFSYRVTIKVFMQGCAALVMPALIHFPDWINSPTSLLCVDNWLCRSRQWFPCVVLTGILWFSGQLVCWGLASERAVSWQKFMHLWRRLEMQNSLPPMVSGKGDTEPLQQEWERCLLLDAEMWVQSDLNISCGE